MIKKPPVDPAVFLFSGLRGCAAFFDRTAGVIKSLYS
jgi:hypothetical protein